MKVLQGRYRVSIRLNNVIVPIEYSDLVTALQKFGYKAAKAPRLPVGTGANLEPAGVVAQLGDSTLDVDIGRGILGIDASSPAEALTGFRQLIQILQKELNIDIPHSTWFVETIAELNVEGSRKALNALRNLYSQAELIKVTTQLLREPTALFGIRIGSAKNDPSGPDWFDLRIEPLLRNSQIYYVNVVYRNSNEEKVLQFVEGLDIRVGKIINSLESGGTEEPPVVRQQGRPREIATSS